MYDQILLPTDGSVGTGRVADHAGSLAERYDATVHVLSVADSRNRFESPASGIAGKAWEESERDRAQTAVADCVAALPDVAVERVVRTGVPDDEILAYVEDEAIDLVVMGTHGRTGLDHYLIGSIAERVVRHSPAPVVTIRLDEE